MSELTPHKERFLHEVEQKLLRKELDAKLLDDGLIHIRWNEKPLCSVDRDGIVRFRPADITGPEVDRQLRTVTQTAAQVKEYSLQAEHITNDLSVRILLCISSSVTISLSYFSLFVNISSDVFLRQNRRILLHNIEFAVTFLPRTFAMV